MKARAERKSQKEEDAELASRLDALMKDPVKRREYVEARVDKVVRHWRKR